MSRQVAEDEAMLAGFVQILGLLACLATAEEQTAGCSVGLCVCAVQAVLHLERKQRRA